MSLAELACNESLPALASDSSFDHGDDKAATAALENENDDLNLDGLRAIRDPNLVRDRRVLLNVLAGKTERKTDYFAHVQSELKPHMRKIVASWMLELCEAQQCHPVVFSLALSYLDRVLSRVAIRKSQFQLLACVCLFLASKFKESVPLTAEKLVVFTDCSVATEEIIVSHTQFRFSCSHHQQN